jgi:hypothetical protein
MTMLIEGQEEKSREVSLQLTAQKNAQRNGAIKQNTRRKIFYFGPDFHYWHSVLIRYQKIYKDIISY